VVRGRWQVAGHPGVAALILVALLVGGILLVMQLHHQDRPPAWNPLKSIGARHAAVVANPAPHRAMPPKPAEPAALLPPVAPTPTTARPAWLRFAVPAPLAGDRPLVAVVIDDLGLDRRRTAAVIELPAPLTLSFMTYAHALPMQAEAGHRAGHELLLHVPMEPLDRRENPGPHALYVAMSTDEILAQLRWGLDRLTGYIGINNHMGSKFTADARGMSVVMAELRRRGLIFLDSKTTAASTAIREAAADGVPCAARDVFLDDELAPVAIDRQLMLVERVARRNGSAVAIGHGHDPTIAALRAWLPTLRQKGLALVPLSAVVRLRLTDAAKAGR
jgi:uncharacterized protein